MDSSSKSIIWDESIPDSFALVKSREHAEQRATQLTRHLTPGGLNHRLYTGPAYLLKFGVAAVVLPDPGPHQDGDNPAQIANRKALQEAFNLQQ